MGTVQLISFADIFKAPNAKELFAEYAAECSIPAVGPVNPQIELYRRMEQSGLSKTFGVFHEEQLIGFATLLRSPLPHYGVWAGTVESLFVMKDHRKGGAGRELIRFVKQYAKDAGCRVIFFSAKTGSQLEKLLYLMREYEPTNTIFMGSLD
jgi:GNAT superfamily N-acetyltransferase